ncbi:MAG: signal peptidase II [Bacteroidales bacterium]|nr:signal peptidase II [Bacteroidales bacterium]
MKKPLIVIFLVLLLDQFSKILVKTTMKLKESIIVFDDWFEINFIENDGMAFGWKFLESAWGTTILILFRIVAITLLFWLLIKLVKKGVKFGPLFGISLILAGAIGNLIDGMFYGLIFDYAGFMQGKVVDMLHFPLFKFPEWVPWLHGEIFFSPVFNVADSAITIGIFYLVIFQWNFVRNFESILEIKKQDNGERD